MPQSEQRDASRNITRDIIRGIAVTCLIFGISGYLPIIGFFCALLLPLPILFYRSKIGRQKAMIIPVVTMVIMGVGFGGISPDILFFFGLLLLGFVLGECFELNLSIEKTILYSAGSVLVAVGFCLFFYSNTSHGGIVSLLSEYVGKNLKLTLALYEDMGMPEENILLISNSLDTIGYVLVRIIPAMAAALTLFVAWTSILLAGPIMKSKHLFYPDFGSLKHWKAPEPTVWFVIGSGLALIFPFQLLKIMGLNCLIVLMTIYFFQGIAIVSFYFEKKRFPRLLKIFIYSIIAMQQMILLLVVGLGFFDMWLNFRKLDINNS
ncbi:MAG: YybS family protein [Deltaproteobacteria bacterium]|nr:YybS family protein [Deltaproteobacteria bacterium]